MSSKTGYLPEVIVGYWETDLWRREQIEELTGILLM